MKRRTFMGLTALSTTVLLGLDFEALNPEAWEARKLNDAALALYGEEKFATLQKSQRVVIEADKFIVPNPYQIPVRFTTDIEAKTVSVFQTANEQSLVAVFKIEEGMIVDYEINIRMERKGTLFVVVEDVEGNLFYTRHFLDVSSLNCVAG